MIPSLLMAIQNTNKVVTPGICQLYAIAKDEITSMPDLASLLQSINPNAATVSISDIVLASGGTINAISNDNHAGTDIAETQKPSQHNPFFTYEAAFELPNDNEVLRGQILRAFDNREWIVIVKQATGSWRIFGNLYRGCDFKSSLSSGSQVKGSSVYKSGFYWESSERALYMNAPSVPWLTFTGITFASIGGDPTFHYVGAGFTGTLAITVQVYQNNQWVTVGTDTLSPGVGSSITASAPLASSAAFARIITSGGISSNCYTIS